MKEIAQLQVFREIFRSNLGVARTESVLVFTDRPSPKEPPLTGAEFSRRESLRHIARMVEAAGCPLCREIRFLEYPATGTHGMEPPRALWRLAMGDRAVDALDKAKLLGPILRKKAKPEQIDEAMHIVAIYKRGAVDAVVALSNFSSSHTTFRLLMTKALGARYASMPLFDAAMCAGPMAVDYKKIARLTREVAAALRKAESVHVTTDEGTDISYSLHGRRAEADTGLLTKPGAFGNLPAGEAYVAPLEGTAEGRMVLRYAPTRPLATPLTLHVKDGVVVKVEGKESYADVLRAKLAERPENANIAELGVGTNDRASRPDNILESEKILGTVHMALGDNSAFGGTVRTPFHQDFIFFHPTLTLTAKDGARTVLLDRGRMTLK